MVIVDFSPKFQNTFKKIKDISFEDKVKKQISKIMQNPKAGKPMRNIRKGTRELYIPPFRLAYAYIESENKIIILDLYHKKFQ